MESPLVTALESARDLHCAPKLVKLFRIPGKLAHSVLASNRNGKVSKINAGTFWGSSMTVVLPEKMSTGIYRYGFLEYELSRALMECVKPGMTFFDIGAHFGYFTCLASYLVGANGHVHSFEPTRSTFGILCENAATRPNVKANNVAAFSSAGTLRFNDFGIAKSAFNSLADARLSAEERSQLQPETYDVATIPIDQYVRETGARPNAVKIDAESAEYEILRGMEWTLTEIKPIVSIEVGDFQLQGVASSSESVQFLISKGYEPYEWHEQALRAHESRRDYNYGNLLFLPRGTH